MLNNSIMNFLLVDMIPDFFQPRFLAWFRIDWAFSNEVVAMWRAAGSILR